MICKYGNTSVKNGCGVIEPLPPYWSYPVQCWAYVSCSSSTVILCNMIHDRMMIGKSDVSHMRAGSRMILNQACNTPNARSISFWHPFWCFASNFSGSLWENLIWQKLDKNDRYHQLDSMSCHTDVGSQKVHCWIFLCSISSNTSKLSNTFILFNVCWHPKNPYQKMVVPLSPLVLTFTCRSTIFSFSIHAINTPENPRKLPHFTSMKYSL